MILQVGGSISFSPNTREAKAKWLDYDTRHMLTELDPKPEFVTVATGTTLWDIISMLSKEDVKGTHLEDPKVQAAWAGMVVDATPAFYLEHLKRLRQHSIQPYFVPAHVHQLEIIERLIRAGVYMGPLNMAHRGLRRRHARPQSVRLDGDGSAHAARRGRDILVAACGD